METFAFRPGEHAPGHTLETSLVEWKPPLQTDFFSGVHTLETSLVEWKHADIGMEVFLPRALETSLVEWKLAKAIERMKARQPWKLP